MTGARLTGRRVVTSVVLLIVIIVPFLIWSAISTFHANVSRIDKLHLQVSQLNTELHAVRGFEEQAGQMLGARLDTMEAEQKRVLGIGSRARSASDETAAAVEKLRTRLDTLEAERVKQIELLVCFWAIHPSVSQMMASSQQAIQSVQKFNGEYHLLGAGVEFHRLTDQPSLDGKAANRLRYQALAKFMDDQQEAGVDIERKVYVIMDGEDSLIARPLQHVLSEFLRTNKRVIISTEKAFTYQFGDKRQMYLDNAKDTPYKFINAGTFMGYGDSLKEMALALDYIMTHDRRPNDMGAMGMFVADWLENKLGKLKTADTLDDFLGLDHEGKIFWVTTNDAEYIKDMTTQGSHTFQNPPYRSPHVPGPAVPAIYHVIGGSREHSGLQKRMFEAIMDS